MYDEAALTDPDYRAKLRAVLDRHFGAKGDEVDLAFEAEALDLAIRVDEPEAWDHAEVARQIDELERALSASWEALLDLPDSVRNAFFARAIMSSRRSGRAEDPPSPIEAAFSLRYLRGVLDPALRAARAQAAEGHPKGRVNWGPVNAIIACRGCWKNCTGEDAPRALNEESPFGHFVREVFELMGIDASPRAAMDAWRKIQSSPSKP